MECSRSCFKSSFSSGSTYALPERCGLNSGVSPECSARKWKRYSRYVFSEGRVKWGPSKCTGCRDNTCSARSEGLVTQSSSNPHSDGTICTGHILKQSSHQRPQPRLDALDGDDDDDEVQPDGARLSRPALLLCFLRPVVPPSYPSVRPVTPRRLAPRLPPAILSSAHREA